MTTTRERLEALRRAEANGDISDTMEIRKTLMARVRDGEITLIDAQLELDRIKRNGRFLGKMTRRQFFK